MYLTTKTKIKTINEYVSMLISVNDVVEDSINIVKNDTSTGYLK